MEGWATYVESYACRYAARNLDAKHAGALPSLVSEPLGASYPLLAAGSRHPQPGMAPLGCVSLSGAVRHHGCVAAASLYQYILETPANYLKYCVGSLSFSQLLSEVREQEGGSFSLIGFHEKLLRLGPLPFPLVEKYL